MAETITLYRGLNRAVLQNQIERYMGMGGMTAKGELLSLLNECRPLIFDAIEARGCSLEVPLSVNGDCVDFDYFACKSHNLSVLLRGCEKAVLVAATLGTKVDMLIKRESVTSKAKALVMNSIGAAAIESFVTQINEEIAEEYSEYSLRPRYSPGYGDLSLETQRDMIRVLDTNRKIGVALSDSLLMTPEKSVTAIIGLGKSGCIHIDKDCDICDKRDCEYRLG